jgi:hypothetical protein
VGIGQRIKQHRLHGREHHGGSADGERDGDECDGGNRRGPAKQPKRVPKIPGDRHRRDYLLSDRTTESAAS